MTLADKIMQERKKKGWSQEELAERMDVSRQAVSKWEMGQSTPDLDKILQMSEMFGVSTDYLLKDGIETDARADAAPSEPPKRRVTAEEADRFLEHRRFTSKRIALGVYLCILSVIPLLLLAAASEVTEWKAITETLAGVLGIGILLCVVAVAVAIFVLCGLRGEPYEYLEHGGFEMERSVVDRIREEQKSYRPVYIRMTVIAVCLCVLSPIPLIVGAFSEWEFLQVALLCVMLAVVGAGVFLFVLGGVRQSAYQILLREGDYASSPFKKDPLRDRIESAFWTILVAIYLGWSFLTHDWHITWVIFPVGGVLSAVIGIVYDIVRKNRP